MSYDISTLKNMLVSVFSEMILIKKFSGDWSSPIGINNRLNGVFVHIGQTAYLTMCSVKEGSVKK